MLIEVCKGQAGLALYVDGTRVAGVRDNGLMTIVLSANVPDARAWAAEKRVKELEAALEKIANENIIDEPFPNENRILHRDDLIKIARAALEAKP
jgi:hypothetical protein